MSTPSASGLLRWGQRGRYTGWDDRVVITALSGRRTGIVAPVRLGAGPGLTVLLDPGWLAVAPCGDGTTAVITSPITLQIQAAPGGMEYREDEIRAEIIDPEAATWSVSVLPEGASASGLILGWVRVPPGAGVAAEMSLVAREQDFSTGGAIPGPVGPPGPQGPPGTSTIIVGTFHNREPADLLAEPLASGHIPAGWDGPGNPANDVDVEIGWSLIYGADGSMWTYVSATGVGGPWLSPGVVTGPPGPPGPAGPPGPQGPAVDLGIGDWVVMPTPGSPAGLGPNTRCRYRLLGYLNAVEWDTNVHIPAAIPQAGAVWSFGVVPADMRPDFYGGQPRIYTAIGNLGIPITGNSNAGESRTSRWHFNPGTGTIEFHSHTNSAGIVSWNAIIPRPAPGGEGMLPLPSAEEAQDPPEVGLTAPAAARGVPYEQERTPTRRR